MKRWNRMLALFLAVLTAAALFAGCAKEEAAPDTAQPAGNTGGGSDELYVVEAMPPSVMVPYTPDSAVGQYIADEFGIAFKFTEYSGDIQEKQALMLAGQEYNELQYMQGENIVQQYINAGALINLDDYRDVMPDFYERYADMIPYWRASAPDGGLYKFERDTPCLTETTFPHNDILVRSDILEYYGWPQLVTASDWKAFLEQALIDFPESYDGQATVGLTMPMAESYGIQGIVPVGYEKGDTYIAAGNDYYTYNVKTEQFEDYLLNPEAKESFQFFNDLYKSGVLDEECFTDTGDITLQKMSNGRAIAVWYVTWNKDTANAALTDAGHPEMSYIQQPFQLDSQAGQDYVMPVRYSYPYYSVGITRNCKDPERLCKFINWCCTDEGQIILQTGLEGVHYTVENGKRVATDLFKQCTLDEDTKKAEGVIGCMAMLPLCHELAADGQPFNLSETQAFVDEFSLTGREKEAFAALGWDSSNGWWNDHGRGVDAGYYQSCSLDAASDLAKVGAKMVETRIKYSANLLMADDFDAAWSELMAEYDKLDHQAVIDAMNANLASHQ